MIETILERLKALNIPVAYREFKDTKQNPAPMPPFICWLSTERQRGSDDKNRIREISASIELYTDRVEDPTIETRIEDEVLFDVEFQKYQATIPDENMVQTAYDFAITQKKAKGV